MGETDLLREVAMRSPFSRTFKWFLLWIGIETIGRYVDPNELINQRPILAIEKTFVPGDRPWTNEDLAYYLYDNAPADYNVKVLGFTDISGYSRGRVRRGSGGNKKKAKKAAKLAKQQSTEAAVEREEEVSPTSTSTSTTTTTATTSPTSTTST